jgi:hypothetical protein
VWFVANSARPARTQASGCVAAEHPHPPRCAIAAWKRVCDPARPDRPDKRPHPAPINRLLTMATIRYATNVTTPVAGASCGIAKKSASRERRESHLAISHTCTPEVARHAHGVCERCNRGQQTLDGDGRDFAPPWRGWQRVQHVNGKGGWYQLSAIALATLNVGSGCHSSFGLDPAQSDAAGIRGSRMSAAPLDGSPDQPRAARRNESEEPNAHSCVQHQEL